MEPEDELHTQLKKADLDGAFTVVWHSTGHGSNATLVAAELGTGAQRQQRRPAHTSKPATKAALHEYGRVGGRYSPARRVQFRARS